jgi:hypothetical protein
LAGLKAFNILDLDYTPGVPSPYSESERRVTRDASEGTDVGLSVRFAKNVGSSTNLHKKNKK